MYYYDQKKKISAEQREKLYNEIWSEPVSKVAPRYGVSDTTLRKWCVNYWDIPVPEAGYWARKNAGKTVRQPLLKNELSEEAKKYVYGYAVSYINLSSVPEAALYTEEPLYVFSEKTKKLLNTILKGIELSLSYKEMNAGLKAKHDALEKEKNVPIWINRAFRIINTLEITARNLEGYLYADLDQTRSSFKGCIHVAGQSFAFLLSPDSPKGKNIKIAFQWDEWWSDYSPDEPSDLDFCDKEDRSIEEQLGSIIYQLFVYAGKQIQAKELKRRKQQREQEEIEFQRKIAPFIEQENEKVARALEDAENYQKATKIRIYAAAYLAQKGELFPEHPELKTYYDWLLARADWIDPLVENDYSAFLESLK